MFHALHSYLEQLGSLLRLVLTLNIQRAFGRGPTRPCKCAALIAVLDTSGACQELETLCPAFIYLS